MKRRILRFVAVAIAFVCLVGLFGCGGGGGPRTWTVTGTISWGGTDDPVEGAEVSAGGVTAVNPARFTYRKVRRPLWGLEP